MRNCNEDRYRDMQLEQYLDGRDDELSACCGCWFLEESDVCSECLEHSISIKEAKEEKE